jgi:RecA/RadA recombinase
MSAPPSSGRSDRPRGVAVELCGVPGSGKSHLTRAVLTELSERGISARDASLVAGREARASRLWRKARGVARAATLRPGLAVATARAVRAAGVDRREQLARTVNLLAHRTIADRASRQAQVVLVDQGIVQELASVGLTGDLDRCLPILPTALTATDLLVVVTVDAPTAAARLEGRATGESRVEVLRGSDLVAALDQQAQALERLAEELPGPGRVVHVEHADGETHAVAGHLADQVAALVQRP